MSQENVEVVRQQFEAILDAVNARDFDSLAEILPPGGMEFRSALAVAEGEEAFTGIDGLRKWAEQVDSTWEGWRQELVDFRVGDNQAVAVLRATGRARASGVPLDTRTGNVLTWGRGRGWRIRAYRDPHEAFEAVGLRE
jgi:ketosteroid isomerase-like protein